MNKATRYLLVCLAILAVARSGHAQPPPGPPGPPPVFANEPTAPPEPEFCPTPHKEAKCSRVPFDGLCPVGNAFSTACPNDTCPYTWYCGLGGMFLRPGGLSSGPLVLLGSGTKDTDSFPPLNSPVAIDYSNIPNRFSGGIRGTLGFYFGANAVEITGFYMLQQATSITVSQIGQLNPLFGAYPAPSGFTTATGGDIWRQADVVTASRTWNLANVEANYRCCVAKGFEFLAGFRYLDYQDRLGIFTDDSVLANNGKVNPLAQADYQVNAHSRILAPQVGFECEQVLVPIVAVGLTGKAGVGPNFVSVQQSLTRGDGFQGPGGSTSDVIMSGVVELTPYVNFWFNDQFRLRLGYTALWALHIPEVQQQVNFNANIPGGQNTSGNQFFHGPLFEFQVAF